MNTVLLLAILIILFLGGAILLARHLRAVGHEDWELTPVARQHFELYHGGQINEKDMHLTKRRFHELLTRGEIERVESSLRPGTQFVVKVRALMEIGTDEAVQILERQLGRQLTDNRLEQNWYWIDLANCLRLLGREESLPRLLECAAHVDDLPLVHFYAAETVCFPGFISYLRELETAQGHAALRLLHRAIEGLRGAVTQQIITEARIGEMIEQLWDHRPADTHPLLVRLFLEVQRYLRRTQNIEEEPYNVDAEDPFEREALHLQRSRMSALEPAIEDYLLEAGPSLNRQLLHMRGKLLKDALLALNDLRFAGNGLNLLKLIKEPRFTFQDEAVQCLRWAENPQVADFLRDWAIINVEPHQRALKPLKAWEPRRPSIPPSFPYKTLLYALRGFASKTNEQFLLVAAHDWDPTYRAEAINSLCWWEPYARAEVLLHLQTARFDHSANVRHAARAALARMGERQALQWFRQALNSEHKPCVIEAIQTIAEQGITLLWPDLDRIVDSDDTEVAFTAREAIELMHEDLDHQLRRKIV